MILLRIIIAWWVFTRAALRRPPDRHHAAREELRDRDYLEAIRRMPVGERW